MSEEPKEEPKIQFKNMKCFDTEGNYLFDITLTEPLQPGGSYFYLNGKNWECVSRKYEPINQNEINEENQIVEFVAVLRQVEKMGVGNNTKKFEDSKIYGERGMKLQAERERLAKQGIDWQKQEYEKLFPPEKPKKPIKTNPGEPGYVGP